MGTINGMPARQARMVAELTNATNMKTAEFVVWGVRASASFGQAQAGAAPFRVRLALRPGGPHDHLFDRVAARIMTAVEETVFTGRDDAATVQAIDRAVGAVRTSECRVSCRVEPHPDASDLARAMPDFVRDEVALAKADIERGLDRTQTENRLAWVSDALVAPVGDEWTVAPKYYVPATAGGHPGRLFWGDYGRFTCMTPDGRFGEVKPGEGYPTRERAEEVLAAAKIHVAAELAALTPVA